MIRVTLSLLVVLLSAGFVYAEEIIPFHQAAERAKEKRAECERVLAEKLFNHHMGGVPEYDLVLPYAKHVLELARHPQPGLTILAVSEAYTPSEVLAGVARLRRAEAKPTLFVAKDGTVHSNMEITLHSLGEMKADDFELKRAIRNQLTPLVGVAHIEYGHLLKQIKDGSLLKAQALKEVPVQQRAIFEALLGEFVSADMALTQAVQENPLKYRAALEAVMNELPSIETAPEQAMMMLDLSMGPYDTLRDDRYVIEEYLNQLARLAQRVNAAVVVSVPVQKYKLLSRSAPIFQHSFAFFNLTPDQL